MPKLLTIILTLAATTAVADEPAYFPLTPGAKWSFAVTTKQDQKTDASEQTLTVEKRKATDGNEYLVLDNLAYAAKDDGVYVVGVAKPAGPVELIAEPRKTVPANPKMGDKWTYRDAAGVTSATCLGGEKVTVPAGEFDAVKIYSAVAAGRDGTERSEVTQWFARSVGLVKSTTLARRKSADGSLAIVETTLELAKCEIPKPAAAKSVPAADNPAASAPSLFAEAESLARKGDHKAALARYDAAIAADPKFARAHAYKTLSHIALKQFDLAQADIGRALALDDQQYAFHEIAGQLKIARGDVKAGKPLYDKAAALAPASAGAIYTDLAAALAMRNDNQLAPDIDKALRTAAAADPPSHEALFALGQSYVNAGRAEGRAFLQRYVQIVNNLPEDKRDPQKLRLAKQLIRAIDAVKGAP